MSAATTSHSTSEYVFRANSESPSPASRSLITWRTCVESRETGARGPTHDPTSSPLVTGVCPWPIYGDPWSWSDCPRASITMAIVQAESFPSLQCGPPLESWELKCSVHSPVLYPDLFSSATRRFHFIFSSVFPIGRHGPGNTSCVPCT